MFFNKQKTKSKYVEAKTPEARIKQRMAIANYYKNKNTSKQNNSRTKTKRYK